MYVTLPKMKSFKWRELFVQFMKKGKKRHTLTHSHAMYKYLVRGVIKKEALFSNFVSYVYSIFVLSCYVGTKTTETIEKQYKRQLYEVYNRNIIIFIASQSELLILSYLFLSFLIFSFFLTPTSQFKDRDKKKNNCLHKPLYNSIKDSCIKCTIKIL